LMEDERERMEHHWEQLGERIEDVQEDWEQKEHDPSVPGAQPEESDEPPEEEAAEPASHDGADEQCVTAACGRVPRAGKGWARRAIRGRAPAAVPQPAVAE